MEVEREWGWERVGALQALGQSGLGRRGQEARGCHKEAKIGGVKSVSLGGLVGQVSAAPLLHLNFGSWALGLGTGPVGTCSFPVPWGCPFHLPLQEPSPERGSREGAIPSPGLDMWEAPSGASA